MPKPAPPALTIDELVASPQVQIIVRGEDLRQQVFSTITLFAEAIRCVEFITMLKWHISELCSRVQDRSMKDRPFFSQNFPLRFHKIMQI